LREDISTFLLLIEKIIKETIIEREERMNKGIKYILGFAVIFVAAVVCVFGIIKYEEMQDDPTANNSSNVGSVNGKQLDKETKIIIEKLSTLTDIDALNSELHLSQAVVDILKKYAPTVNYAIDNSEGYDKIYFRIGGYYTGNNTNGIDEIIGSYKELLRQRNFSLFLRRLSIDLLTRKKFQIVIFIEKMKMNPILRKIAFK